MNHCAKFDEKAGETINLHAIVETNIRVVKCVHFVVHRHLTLQVNFSSIGGQTHL